MIEKELLRPNVVYYPRTGPVSFSDQDLEDICQASRHLITSGRHPPIPLEHRDDAKPVKLSHEDNLSEMTRHNTGWVQDFFRKKDGSFWAKLGVIDPDVAAKIKDGRIKYVSPEITPILPADGQVHRNVVTHVALTHQPVWAGQKPFAIPDNWVGDDGAVSTKSARLSLLSGNPIRLSMADAEPPDTVKEQLQFGYRIPGGAQAKGVWVRGTYHPKHVAKKVLSTLDDDEKRDLLRKLNARQSRHLPRDFAGLLEHGEAREYPTQVQSIPAAHLSLHDDLPPFQRAHPAGEPVMVWEDPSNGETHAVSGHDLLKKLGPDADASVPVLKVHAQSPYEARGSVLMSHLMDGSAHPEDLAGLFMDGADPKELRTALQESGCSPHEPVFHKAEYLAGLREDDPDATLADKPKQMSTEAGKEEPPEESLFSYAPGYDPDEHRWQHWLQSHFEDPGDRAAFAAAHGKERPANHGDFLARKDAFHKQRFSSGGKPVDYFEMTKPKDEEKPKDEAPKKDEGEEKGEKTDAPAEPKKEPPMEAAKEHKFEKLLKLLEKFKAPLDSEKIKSAEDVCEQLETLLHGMDKAGAGADMGGKADMGMGADGGKQLEAEQGSMFMSLKVDNDALKKALLEKDQQILSLEQFATTSVFSLIEKDTDTLQAKGQCTKAQRDDWLGRIKGIASKQRFSLLEPDKSVEMASVCAEIRMARSIPEGTFLPKKEVAPVQDLHAMLFSNSPVPNGTNGSAAKNGGLVVEPNPHQVSPPIDGLPDSPEKKAEFEETWKNIRMSLGIK